MLSVYLVEMRDSLARCARVAWSLGADRVVLVRSSEIPRKHLFTARALVIESADTWPDDTLILEVGGRRELGTLTAADWAGVSGVAVGGASFGFCRADLARCPSARITSRRPCMIGDQALAIALHCRANSR